ncbi:MAG: hypothetical protein ACTSRU_12170 [Candidatus Hodarchaeales archaeon]
MDDLASEYGQFEIIRKKLEEIPGLRCFAIGGTYMQGLFPYATTKDIDMVITVVESTHEKMVPEIKSKLSSLGYMHRRKSVNPWRFEARNEEKAKLDVFIQEVSDFKITETMLKRVRGGKLAPEDYVFFKIQATREDPKDIDDIAFLLENIEKKFRWRVFFGELKTQLIEYRKKTSKAIVLSRIVEIGYKLNQVKEASNKPQLVPGKALKQMEEIYHFFNR